MTGKPQFINPPRESGRAALKASSSTFVIGIMQTMEHPIAGPFKMPAGRGALRRAHAGRRAVAAAWTTHK
jgi:hypothetical protein